MATKKAKSAKKSTKKSKKTSKASASRASSGPVPPYGEAIRGAVARGDVRQMKDLASSTRKWLADVEAALAQLDSAIKKSGA